jgi:GNAT superfamily N-acetyltransferase
MSKKGIGTQLFQALTRWCHEQGAENLYLQVLRDNEAALNLYTRLGFTHTYDYHYRIRS